MQAGAPKPCRNYGQCFLFFLLSLPNLCMFRNYAHFGDQMSQIEHFIFIA